MGFILKVLARMSIEDEHGLGMAGRIVWSYS